MHSVFLALSLLSAAVAVPTPASELKNLLVPNENGELVYATPEQIKEHIGARGLVSLSKRDDCDDEGSALNKASVATCQLYCERTVTDVIDGPVKVSADIDCSVATCSIAHAESTTITESISINLGGSSGAGDSGAATLTAGVSYTWSKAETTSDTYTFSPVNGDKGYIVFRPYLKQSCGKFLQWSKNASTGPFSQAYCDGTPSKDDNACGKSPKKLSTGKADGEFTFCNLNTNEGC